MTRLIISNQLTEETALGAHALPPDRVQFLGTVAHRLIWLAGEGDVVVLPSAPDPDFVDQVWHRAGITGTVPRIVVPPPGAQGDGLLYDDRLADPGFVQALRELVVERGTTEIVPFFYDPAIGRLADEVGLSGAISGFAFLDQGGNELVNSKSVFRAIAAGVGAAIPDGRVVGAPAEAEEFIAPLLEAGRLAIVKQDVHGGGYGNELLAPVPDVDCFGAAATVTVPDRIALSTHLDVSWHRYSQGGRRRVVVEEYLPGCVPIYAELTVGEAGAHLYGYGEVRMKETDRGPTMTGLIVPPPSAVLPAFDGFLAAATRIGRAAGAMGYRGNMSIDAIVTPDSRILFNEFNGRVGGSTHVHHLAEALLGPDYLTERVVVARSRCRWSSIGDAMEGLAARGLAFDPERRRGVLITGDDGQCVVIAEDLPSARAIEDELAGLLGLVAV